MNKRKIKNQFEEDFKNAYTSPITAKEIIGSPEFSEGVKKKLEWEQEEKE